MSRDSYCAIYLCLLLFIYYYLSDSPIDIRYPIEIWYCSSLKQNLESCHKVEWFLSSACTILISVITHIMGFNWSSCFACVCFTRGVLWRVCLSSQFSFPISIRYFCLNIIQFSSQIWEKFKHFGCYRGTVPHKIIYQSSLLSCASKFDLIQPWTNL